MAVVAGLRGVARVHPVRTDDPRDYLPGSRFCLLRALPASRLLAITWNFVPWAIVVFGVLSVLWSMEPMVSARAAPQIGITVLAAIMFAQGLPARAFIAALMYAQTFFDRRELFHIRHFWRQRTASGFNLPLAMLSSVWVLLDRNQPKYARAIALSALIGAPYMLLSAGSEGALLTGFMAIAGSLAIFLCARAANRVANGCVLARPLLSALVALGIAFLSIDHLFDMFLLSIGKDTSLTGRTVLWSRAAGIISDYPWGGVGLQAFWVEGNAEAIRFWEMFYIYGHAGFHFHDLWLEMGVELGLIGIIYRCVDGDHCGFQRLAMGASRPRTGKLLFCRIRHAHHDQNRRRGRAVYSIQPDITDLHLCLLLCRSRTYRPA